MIESAKSLWKKFNTDTCLGASEWNVAVRDGKRYSDVSFSGHKVQDGDVRIYGKFVRPADDLKRPVVLVLPDAGKPLETEILEYFAEKGYAALMPDYSGKMPDDQEGELRTTYPVSLSYANYEQADLYQVQGTEAEKTAWFEWTYVALYAIEYLKSREDVASIGVIGIRKGGNIAWQTFLSPDVKCGIPVNAAGWQSFLNVAKFGTRVASDLSNETHRYIAAVEAQSYAPYAKCPVLMLCALRDLEFDCDRAYDTYSRIGVEEGNALVYSSNTGACIGPHALTDMDLFLEKNLKGREIYIPDTLNVMLAETSEGVEVTVLCDKEGILEEVGIYYSEANISTKSSYREWRRVMEIDGKSVKDGEVKYTIQPFGGATSCFVYAYAKYINGFRVMSKIISKRFENVNENAVKGRMLFSGKETDCFVIANHEDISVGEIFLEREAIPKITSGYGNIQGAYSLGGIKTYKISSPRYIPDENALLEFDVYFKTTGVLTIAIESAEVEKDIEHYTHSLSVKGGGKWKRIILKADDFKGESHGMPLQSFSVGNSLAFHCQDAESEYVVTNILWL